jgi:hypothetical protein
MENNQFKPTESFQGNEDALIQTLPADSSVIDQDTRPLASSSANEPIPKVFQKILNRMPTPIERIGVEFFTHIQDTEPERPPTKYQSTTGLQSSKLGVLPILALLSALGLVSVALAFADSLHGGTELRLFLYPGLLLIFTPAALRLISPAASRIERIGLLCVTGMSLYIIKVMSSPLYF